MRRAIVAVGRQDVDTDSLQPRDPQIEILGGSSDHLLLDLTHCTTVYQVGDRIQFTLGYGSMLKAFTSPYVEKSSEPQISAEREWRICYGNST